MSLTSFAEISYKHGKGAHVTTDLGWLYTDVKDHVGSCAYSVVCRTVRTFGLVHDNECVDVQHHVRRVVLQRDIPDIEDIPACCATADIFQVNHEFLERPPHRAEANTHNNNIMECAGRMLTDSCHAGDWCAWHTDLPSCALASARF